MAGVDNLNGDLSKLNIPSLRDALPASSNKDLMEAARLALSGNWSLAVLGHVLYTVLIVSFSLFMMTSIAFVSFISEASGANVEVATRAMNLFASFVQVVISGAFVVGYSAFFLGIGEEGQACLDLLFVGFQRFWKSFGVYFFVGLFTFFIVMPAVALPLVGIFMAQLFSESLTPGMMTYVTGGLALVSGIAAIILSLFAWLRYAMSFFAVADDDECGSLEAVRRSRDMMKGHKWKLFCLHWRFFGWWLLATLFTLGLGFLWLIPYMQTSLAKFYEDVR